MPLSPLSEIINNYKNLFKKIFSYWPKLLPNLPFTALILAIIYYIYNFSLVSILAQNNFYTGAHDVGIYDQIIWLFSRFMSPYSTLGGTLLFGFHVSLNCILLAPLFWLWPNINMLYVAQSVFLALPAIPLFLYAKKKTASSFLALAVGLSYLMYPALQNMNLENFHPETITIFFLSWATYFMLTKNFKLFYPFILLTAAGKEEMGFIVFVMGLFLLILKKETRHGIITASIGLIWFMLCAKVIMPMANSGSIFSSSEPLIYSHWFGAFLRNIFNPAYYWKNLTHPETIKYLKDLLSPVLYLPLLSPTLLFLLIPALSINILSGIGCFRSIDFHYNYVVICFIFFGLIKGISLINKLKVKNARLKTIVIIIIGTLLIFNSYRQNKNLSKFPLGKHGEIIKRERTYAQSEGVRSKKEALSLIPKEAKVSASYSFFPQLSHRKEIYMFPNPFSPQYWDPAEPIPPALQHVDYVALDLGTLSPEQKMIADFLSRSAYFETIFFEGPVLILKRIPVAANPNNGVNYKTKDKTGKVSAVYFPDSRNTPQNLFGEKVPAEKNAMLELFGYLFIPEAGEYGFKLQSAGLSFMEIEDKILKGPINLKQGFYKYKINYLNSGQSGLRLAAISPKGKEYIISDRDLFLKYAAEQFEKILGDYGQKKKEREKFMRRQENKVKNSGFESSYGHQPKEWEIERWYDKDAVYEYKVDSKAKKNGKYSAKVSHQGLADSRWVQKIAVKPSTSFRLSGWIKTVGVKRRGNGAYLEVPELGARTEAIFGTQDWQYKEIILKTGKQDKAVHILCRFGDYGAPNEGMVYFDEIELKELPAAPPGI